MVSLVVGTALLSGAAALHASSQPSSQAEQGRVRVSPQSASEGLIGQSDRSVEVLAEANVCWEMQVADLGPAVEYCGRGGVDLPGGFGASGAQKAQVRITKTRGTGPVTVTVSDRRSEVTRADIVNVNDSLQVP